MTAPVLIRPPRVTTACLFVGLSCVMIFIYVASTLSNWGSIEVREQVQNVLADDRFKAAGLDVTDVMGWLRWALMGAAAVAGAGVVLAIYTAMGHQASRIILTVMCGLGSLVFLAGGLFGILPAAFSIFCGIYLWTPDSRQWFAVKNGKMAAPEVAEKVQVDPFATPVVPPVAEQAPQPVTTATAATVRAPRPQAVLSAGLIAMIMSSMVAVACASVAVTYLLAKDEYVRALSENPMLREAVRGSGMSMAELARTLFIVCVVLTLVALVGVAAAGATLAGNKNGRSLLVALSFLTVLLSIPAFPIGLMWTAGAIATLVLLRRPEVRNWYE